MCLLSSRKFSKTIAAQNGTLSKLRSALRTQHGYIYILYRRKPQAEFLLIYYAWTSLCHLFLKMPQGTSQKAQGTRAPRHRAQDTGHRAQGTGHKEQGTRAQGTRHGAPGHLGTGAQGTRAQGTRAQGTRAQGTREPGEQRKTQQRE